MFGILIFNILGSGQVHFNQLWSYRCHYFFSPTWVDWLLFPFLPSDHVFLCFAPSLVAAACVATSRLILHLSPTWPPRLQLLTGYTWENLIPCAEKLLMCVSDCTCLWKLIKKKIYMTVVANHNETCRNSFWWQWCRWMLTARSTCWHTLHKGNRISRTVQSGSGLYI